MSEWKEVWHLWNGSSDLPFSESIRFFGGINQIEDVVAYSVGEQRRRCQACGGSKVSPDLGHGFEHNCQYCNATGWEYRKCD